MDNGRITLGRGCVHGHPFSQFCVERAEGGWGGEGVVVTMALSKWRLASCIIWVRKVDVTMVASTSLLKQQGPSLPSPLSTMKRERGCDGHINPSSPDEAGLPWGEGVHGHPFSHFIVEEVREVAGGGCGGDKVHLGSTTLSQGIDQSQVGRNICCVASD